MDARALCCDFHGFIPYNESACKLVVLANLNFDFLSSLTFEIVRNVALNRAQRWILPVLFDLLCKVVHMLLVYEKVSVQIAILHKLRVQMGELLSHENNSSPCRLGGHILDYRIHMARHIIHPFDVF